jgi:hypothetical protein
MGPKLNYTLYTNGADRMFALVRAVFAKGFLRVQKTIVKKTVREGQKSKGVRHLTMSNPFFIGGAERDRTAGLQSAILALSQLSYCPVLWK